MPYIENYEEFAKRHGTDYVRTPEKWYLFADGAIAESYPGGWHGLEPPAQERERLQLIIQFWAAKLSPIELTFNTIKSAIARIHEGQSNVHWDEKQLGPRPEGGPKAWLTYLASAAKAPREKLTAAQSALASLPEVIQDAERQRRLQRAWEIAAAEDAKLQHETESITL